MDQLATKGKKCKLAVCKVCKNSNSDGSAGSGDFVDCEKCGLSIHKICFKLSGDLLKIFQDFERRNEKFPFTVLCSDCRQFTDKNINEVQVVDSCEESDNSKNPLEIDCIVNVIVDHLNVQDLVNVRLVNKLWNQNASRILSKESRQDQLKAYDVIGKNPVSADLEKCLQIVERSEQKKLMHKWKFYLDQDQNPYSNEFKILKVFNQIITITNPTRVTIHQYDGNLNLEEDTLFSTLLTNISENVVDLSTYFEDIPVFDQTQFCMPKFSKLKSIKIESISLENYKFVKKIVENSPKLMNLSLGECGIGDLTLDDFITEKSTYCLLTEISARNLEILKISSTDFNFEFETFEMKLQTLSLHANHTRYLKFGEIKKFLISQNDTLENLKITILHDEFAQLDEVEDLENAQLNLPRLENVQHFSLAFQINRDVYDPDKEVWPVKPINLAVRLPNLKKITIENWQSWALCFETGQNCHSGVTELVLTNWTDGDLTKLVELFPQVKLLNLKQFCFNTKGNGVKIYTQLGNLNGWSERLKRLEISCEYYHLENFDFEKLVCLSNLESIKISKLDYRDFVGNSNRFIYPDFKPLFKIATLSQLAIKNFKISKGIVEDLREKYPSLDYSFYPN